MSKNLLQRKLGLDKYFLEEQNPFSKKRKIKTGNLKILLGIVLGVLVFALLFLGNDAEKKQNTEAAVTSELPPTNAIVNSQTTSGAGSLTIGGQSGISLGGGYSGGGFQSSRQFTSSQLVKAAEGSSFANGLPMGTTFKVRLSNTLISSDSNQPVIAELIEDGIWDNSVLIPIGTKVIGSAQFDDAAKRLQIRFHSLIYPEGDQHSFSGIALLPDGSSGIPGDYHSGAFRQQVGKFSGDFVGGFAEGMKDRQMGSQGMVLEKGSIRNGVFNGISNSTLDQARSYSEDIANVKPFLKIEGGSEFLLYFEKEFVP